MTTKRGAGDSPPGLTILKDFLSAHPNITFIRYQILDYGGVLRVRETPVARALLIAAGRTGPVTTASPSISCLSPYNDVYEHMVMPGNDLWHPDWTSLRECIYAPGHATVMCSVEETCLRANDQSFAEDPRTILQKSIEAAEQKIGASFLVGFEVEFSLFDSQEACRSPRRQFTWYGSRACSSSDYAIVEAVVTALESTGISVWGFHCEGSLRGFEIALAHKAPLQAVDDLIHTEEAIKAIAARHGLFATLHPRVCEEATHNGMHLNMSISKSEYAEYFLGAIMKHWRALTALALPNHDSYARLSDSKLAWGQQYKFNIINECRPGLLELRAPDAFANMYLLIAAIIGCTVEAVSNKTTTSIKPNSTLSKLDGPIDEHFRSLGVTERTPKTLEEAVLVFRQDGIIEKALGSRAFKAYADGKELEAASAKKLTTDQRRSKTLDFV